MDLDKYIKRSEQIGRNQPVKNSERPCLECGKPIRQEGNIGYGRFCSAECKNAYVHAK